MLDQWNHQVLNFPPPSAPSPGSSLSALAISRPEPGAHAAGVLDGFAVALVSEVDNGIGFDLSSVKLPAPWFIYSFMGVGIVLCCITFIGCIAAESINGCCLCFYTLLKIVLIQIEAALVAFIAIDRSWEKDIPFDPTGELDTLQSFIKDNIDICKWIGISVVIIQALALLVAIILRAMVSSRRLDIDDEDDYESNRGPLLNPQSSHTSASAKGDGREPHSDIWELRMREKYGLNSGDRYNGAYIYSSLNQNASASMKSK
ncbi:Tetraspanin-18 [Hibiscus syriacus]|uniref:Tetraspanin-18 n=1 Tax=Hibiscus syriacus TaxID=106335 RepID=A0A6A2X1S9_HIBSY|nr:Tetraspanin-18 [Hibiscus syriacus]